MPERILKELRKSRLWMLVGGFVIILLLGLLAYVVYVDRNNDSDRRKREAASKIEARVESTKLYNTDQTKRREFQIDNILTLVDLGGKQTIEEVKAKPEFAKYVEFVNKSYPYRQTSVACVTALFDPAIPDCPPASNEAGDP